MLVRSGRGLRLSLSWLMMNMKTIYLFRHAEPLRFTNMPDSQWPLSEHGHSDAAARFDRSYLKMAVRVYSSPFLRALETARHAELPVTADSRLQERHAGTATSEMGDCWLRQYEDTAFKCLDGESFDEVRQRMSACIEDILTGLKDGESAVVVSHAAAICAYLMLHCDIKVTNRITKTREITWRGQIVYTGNMPPLTGFSLAFHQGMLKSIETIT